MDSGRDARIFIVHASVLDWWKLYSANNVGARISWNVEEPWMLSCFLLLKHLLVAIYSLILSSSCGFCFLNTHRLFLKDNGILIIPTVCDPPPKLNSKKSLLAEFHDRTYALLGITSMSGGCQVIYIARF